jgi:hypothetical protein
MATPEATFFVFLFHSPCFHPFTTNVTRALPLEAIKGETGATSKGVIKQQQLEPTLVKTTHHTTTHKRPMICFLSQKFVTPTMSTPVQGNTSHNKTHWT